MLNPKSNERTKVVSITYEEIGLFPRSFSRVFDRFLKQVFSDVDNLGVTVKSKRNSVKFRTDERDLLIILRVSQPLTKF